MNKAKAFTLIELLVVIAIIALLLAIMIPALKRVKNAAKDMVCLSHLRQIGMAAIEYAEENDQTIPRNAGGNLNTDPFWVMAIAPYVGFHTTDINDYLKIEIYNCPRYPNKEQTVDYATNSWDNVRTGGWSNLTRKLSAFSSPSNKIYLNDIEDAPTVINDNGQEVNSAIPIIRNVTDIMIVGKRTRLDVCQPNHLPNGPAGSRRIARNRHKKEGSNAMFLDGHSDWIHKDDNLPRLWYEN